MTVDIISRSISMKVWDRAAIKLGTPGSAVRQTRYRLPTRPGIQEYLNRDM